MSDAALLKTFSSFQKSCLPTFWSFSVHVSHTRWDILAIQIVSRPSGRMNNEFTHVIVWRWFVPERLTTFRSFIATLLTNCETNDFITRTFKRLQSFQWKLAHSISDLFDERQVVRRLFSIRKYAWLIFGDTLHALADGWGTNKNWERGRNKEISRCYCFVIKRKPVLLCLWSNCWD